MPSSFPKENLEEKVSFGRRREAQEESLPASALLSLLLEEANLRALLFIAEYVFATLRLRDRARARVFEVTEAVVTARLKPVGLPLGPVRDRVERGLIWIRFNPLVRCFYIVNDIYE